MSSNAVVVALCALTLGVSGYVAVNVHGRGLGFGGDPDGGEAAGEDGSAADRLAALERRTAEMTAALGELRETVARMDRRSSRGTTRAVHAGADAAAPASAPAGPDAGAHPVLRDGTSPDAEGAPPGTASAPIPGAPFSGADGDAYAARLERRIEAVAARERARGEDGKWKAPIDELADELGAEAAAKADMARVFDDGRDQVCRVLLTHGGDGVSLLDDYARDIRETGDGTAATQRFFKRVIAEKVPGTDETYFAAITRIQGGVERDLSRVLGDARMAKLRALRVDLLDVRTGHDPVGDALRERLQK